MAKISATLLALLATHTCALGTEPTTAASTPTAEEWLETSQPSVLSAATAVLQAVVMTPSPFRISVSGADASSSAQRFQAAQASAAALLVDNTLEWLLAQPNVTDTVRDLLRTDRAGFEARKYTTTPHRPSTANTSRDEVAPHATNWTARAAEVRAARERLRQMNDTSPQDETGSSSRAAVIGPAVNSSTRSQLRGVIFAWATFGRPRPARFDVVRPNVTPLASLHARGVCVPLVSSMRLHQLFFQFSPVLDSVPVWALTPDFDYEIMEFLTGGDNPVWQDQKGDNSPK